MKKRIITVFLALIMISATSVFADSISNFNCLSSGCGSTNYGSVTLSGSGTVHVSVSLASGWGFVSTGSHHTFGFNIAGSPDITISNLSVGFSAYDPNASTSAIEDDALKQSGFQYFMYAVENSNGNGGSNAIYGTLSFDVTAAGLTQTDFKVTSFLPAGKNGDAGIAVYFTADIINQAGATMPVGALDWVEPSPTPVPEPTSLLLMGSGLLAVGLAALRKKK